MGQTAGRPPGSRGIRSVQGLSSPRGAQDRPEERGAAAGGPLSLLSFQRFDPSLLDSSSLLVGDRSHHVQIGRGMLHGQADQLCFDESTIRIGSFSQTMRVEVRFPDDRVTIGLALHAPQPIRVLGKRFASSDLVVFAAAEEIDVVFTPGARWVTFNLPIAQYAMELAAIAEDPALHRPRGAPRLRPSDAPLERVRRGLTALEGLAHGRPELFGDVQWRVNAERGLRDGFFGLLEDAALLEREAADVRLRSAHRVVREAEARLDEDDAPIPSIGALCRSMGVSRRTLERAFGEALDMSPAGYFRIRALTAVRRALLDAEPRPGVIARLAVDQGFWHLGRFAQSYRALFGERPVDTLRRRGRTMAS